MTRHDFTTTEIMKEVYYESGFADGIKLALEIVRELGEEGAIDIGQFEWRCSKELLKRMEAARVIRRAKTPTTPPSK